VPRAARFTWLRNPVRAGCTAARTKFVRNDAFDRFHERVNLQIRGDAFNVFNHTNPLAVNASFTSPLFGQVTSYRDPRIIQLSAKISF
jgi:hypothetical protein